MNDNEEIYVLISRHLSGNITDQESSLLNNWISENEKHKVEFDDIVDLWEKSGILQFPGKINSNRALNTVHEKAGIEKVKVFKLSVIQQIAAILFLSVLLSGAFSYFLSNRQSNPVYYEEVNAAYGTRTNIELPEGTLVYLNSGSSLRFSNHFAKQNERRVELKGEGFFKVAKDAKRPFIVQANKLEVTALGTEFNVNAYNPDSRIEIALIEGKVAIDLVNTTKSERVMVLDPGQLARFDVTENKIYKESIVEHEKYIGWIDGKMIFMDDPIQEVMKRMESWYNVEIQVEDEQLMNYRFTGTFINESLEEILTVFSLTSPLQYEINPATKNSDGEYSKRTIILKAK
ncbi:MAG: hypothetical protein A2W90_22695 [Bacteroidetes bacterium GWF2_42_66]|nr:MAG: hypothetical protein A2W92_22100 [Bacteroidetes bacterium GWA2_42_15]OFY03139.1 MAG: hypothetical protein A2W89_13475 [Bacteroidetes bacterium GWE2_42_39]OFY45247.1 MAG: hypothetical protein A2W90_22695 [Bacteroidetes bacterium GWF2_42_66]HAZ02143.1 hypothetical protein [Marinilabiliales bacterium]HBL74094.1 hypothetical protein [Prolixibacteraceae bacterium]